MTKEELELLYERCLSGAATIEEQKLLEEYKDEFDFSDIPWAKDMGDYESVKINLKKDLKERILKSKVKKLRIYYWSAAASVLITVGVVSFFAKDNWYHLKSHNSVVQSEIKPGGNKAILILSDGSKVLLDSSKTDSIPKQDQVVIIMDQKTRLHYQKQGSDAKDSVETFNTLIVPRGGQYNLVLSDGTKVWMNADSRLKYPVDFVGKERSVELTGEAYFEVAKNKLKPFKVIANDNTVEVLGTHFNVHAYPDEPYLTTLLEGSVKLKNKAGLTAMLNPGEQGMFNARQQFDVIKVNANDAIAWKNGIFLFKHDNIQNVMKKICRWYDIDVEYQGNVYSKKLGGSVSRYQNINDLLKTIQLTESVHFKIIGRRVIVMP